MKTALEVMEQATTVPTDMSVKDLALLLVQQHLDGVCVVDDQGALVGVVTSMDLIYQEKRLHLPTFFMLFDSVLPLQDPRKAEGELHKIAGSTVADVMTAHPLTVGPDTPIDQVASLMVEKHITVVPVSDNRRLLGVVTKPAVLRSAFGL